MRFVVIGLLAWLAGCTPSAPAPVASSRPASAPPPDVKVADLERLVRDLADVEEAGIGFSPSVTGQQFLPIASADEQGMMLLQQAPPKRSPVLTRLVEAGVAAAPVLLRCLDDATPTKLPPMKALMWSAAEDEYDFNRRTTPRPAGVNREGSPEAPMEHRVTVGDLCFVALGQIVNRSFAAVRYQPTGGLVINSPPSSPALRAAIRGEWAGLTAPRLEASLARDFEEPDHDFRREGALRRLGYYFPETAKRLLAAELQRPTYDSDAVRALVRELYASDAPKRARLFRDHVDAHGAAAKDGTLQALFDDLDGQEAYEQKRVSPANAGADIRARECLVELFGYAATVKSTDKPYPAFSSKYARARLIEGSRK